MPPLSADALGHRHVGPGHKDCLALCCGEKLLEFVSLLVRVEGTLAFRNSQLKMMGLRICTYTQSSGKPGAQPCNESGSGDPIGLQWDLWRDMRGWPGSEAGIPAVVWAPHCHWEAQLHAFDIWLQLDSHPKEGCWDGGFSLRRP